MIRVSVWVDVDLDTAEQARGLVTGLFDAALGDRVMDDVADWGITAAEVV